MAVRELRGNLFSSNAAALVNTVNCVGDMGKGVALEFRYRFPDMFLDYQMRCRARELRPGDTYVYTGSQPMVINMAVKNHWRYPSQLTWVTSCLSQFTNMCHSGQLRDCDSFAFPWIGAMNGGLEWPRVHALMRQYLDRVVGLDIEIFEFDDRAPEPLFLRLQEAAGAGIEHFAQRTALPMRTADLVLQQVCSGKAASMAQLWAVPGIGAVSMDKLYAAFRTSSAPAQAVQLALPGLD